MLTMARTIQRNLFWGWVCDNFIPKGQPISKQPAIIRKIQGINAELTLQKYERNDEQPFLFLAGRGISGCDDRTP